MLRLKLNHVSKRGHWLCSGSCTGKFPLEILFLFPLTMFHANDLACSFKNWCFRVVKASLWHRQETLQLCCSLWQSSFYCLEPSTVYRKRVSASYTPGDGMSGNFCHITGPLWGESTGHWGISLALCVAWHTHTHKHTYMCVCVCVIIKSHWQLKSGLNELKGTI